MARGESIRSHGEVKRSSPGRKSFLFSALRLFANNVTVTPEASSTENDLTNDALVGE